MKRITMAALIAAAIAALVFTGCTSGDPDLQISVKPAYIIGGVTAGDATGTDMWSTMRVPLTFVAGKAIYKFKHTAEKESTWGAGAGKTAFKLLLDEGGATAWATNGTAPLPANTELVTDVNGANNIVLSGLTIDKDYEITIVHDIANNQAIKIKFKQL